MENKLPLTIQLLQPLYINLRQLVQVLQFPKQPTKHQKLAVEPSGGAQMLKWLRTI